MTNQPTSDKRFVFPPWTNRLPPLSVAAVLFGLVGAIFGVWYYFFTQATSDLTVDTVTSTSREPSSPLSLRRRSV